MKILATRDGKGRFAKGGLGFWYGKKHPMSDETKKKISMALKSSRNKENHPGWKGGRIITNPGYIMVYLPANHPLLKHKKYIFEHRLVMEKHLGRFLSLEERVHHVNGIKTDNRIENLKLYKNESEHQRNGKHDRKPNSGSFKKGHKRGMTGKTHSEATKEKMRKS